MINTLPRAVPVENTDCLFNCVGYLMERGEWGEKYAI